MKPPTVFHLKVQKIDKTCLFELSWGQGQQRVATLPYPATLTELYQDWQRAYLSFYKTVEMPLPPTPISMAEDGLRGRVVESGSVAPVKTDWRAKLVQAEAKLLNEFHHWLRSAELFEIRAAIVRGAQHINTHPSQSAETDQHTDVFLTCTPMELARLPWEAWEIGTDFAAIGNIRLVRTPANISNATTPQQRRGRARILAILGDDTGLDFEADREAVRSLSGIAEVRFVGWQPGQTATQVKTQIIQAIADEEGWDVLFFAGHSNESNITGGEVAIAPGVSISISEIIPQLTAARQRGLQVAIFNSCSGLDIAESLINLGFSQVAVMREPIHNRVAQEFLVRFLQALAEHKDVHAALLTSCQFLKLERNFTYPSAYLVPSLFCHPGACLFCIKPFGWKQRLKASLPTRVEAIAMAIILTLGLLATSQDFLLDRRIWFQAIFRDVTHQVPPPTTPPVTLVQIDNRSIQLSGMVDPHPIDRKYLARLVDRLTARGAKVVGIDYLLDRQIAGNDVLSKSIQSSIAKQGTWFVFAAIEDPTDDEVRVAPDIAKPTWSLAGKINALPNHLRLPETQDSCYQICPFAYLLALIYAANHSDAGLPQPQLNSSTDLDTQLLNFTRHQVSSQNLAGFIRRLHYRPLTNWSSNFEQLWLRPVIDFSIPDDRVYQRIPAWQLLEQNSQTPALPSLSQQVVIIAAGGYNEAGIGDSEDTAPMPAATAYWRTKFQLRSPKIFTGAEVHTYIAHHLLTRRLVIPIPDIWMVGVAVLLGKGLVLLMQRQQQQQTWTRKRRVAYITGLIYADILYGFVGLQAYISFAILLPWFLPSAIFWVYALRALRRKSNA